MQSSLSVQQPLIHIGALTFAHNRIPFAIRARVIFDFRDDSGKLYNLRLQAVPSPPVSIDLTLQDRWCTALANVRKRQLLQISGAAIRRSEDPEINNLRLELNDVPTACKAIVTLIDDSQRPISIVRGSHLEQGAMMLDNPTPAPPPTWADPLTSSGSRPSPRIQFTEGGSKNTYTSIADIYADLDAFNKKKINIYGVIIDARAPCTTRGPDLRSEIIVADESSIRDMKDGQTLKTISVYCFEKNPTHAIPYRAVGDVIRCHRIVAGKYIDNFSDVPKLQGTAKFYTTFLLWSHEDISFQPFASREAIPIRGNRETSVHIVTPQDHECVTSLREFTSNYLFKQHKIFRPFLKTVIEVKNADAQSSFMDKNFDLICRFEREEAGSANPQNLRFLVSDGLIDNGKGGEYLVVESNISEDHLQSSNNSSFKDFCPSWSSRPRDKRAWLMIRDATVKSRNGEREIALNVSKKTSTLLWQSENAPDVRNVRTIFNAATSGDVPFPSTEQQPATAPSALPSRYQNHRPDLGNTPIEKGVSKGGLHTSTNENFKDTVQKPPGQNQNDNRSDETDPLHGSDAIPPVESHSSLQKNSTNPQSRRKRRRVEETEASLGAINESRIETFRSNTGIIVKLISRHNFEKLQISSLNDIKRLVSEGNLGVHRVRLAVRACVTPRDLRFACKPWCDQCGIFLKIDVADGRLDCFRCSNSFTNIEDSKISWAFSVKLLLEDEDGRRIEAVVSGDEGPKFFTGLQPTNLIKNVAARKNVSSYLQVVLDPENRLDCAVKPYEYMDSNGIYHVACQIVDTRLIDQFIPEI